MAAEAGLIDSPADLNARKKENEDNGSYLNKEVTETSDVMDLAKELQQLKEESRELPDLEPVTCDSEMEPKLDSDTSSACMFFFVFLTCFILSIRDIHTMKILLRLFYF